MVDFRMNWHDFRHNQFRYEGVLYHLSEKEYLSLSSRIFFLLNIHRGRYVSTEDLLDFMYMDVDPDNWPDYQQNVFYLTLRRIRKLLPAGVKITNTRGKAYMLEFSKPDRKEGEGKPAGLQGERAL